VANRFVTVGWPVWVACRWVSRVVRRLAPASGGPEWFPGDVPSLFCHLGPFTSRSDRSLVCGFVSYGPREYHFRKTQRAGWQAQRAPR